MIYIYRSNAEPEIRPNFHGTSLSTHMHFTISNVDIGIHDYSLAVWMSRFDIAEWTTNTDIYIYIQIYIESTYINDLPNIFPQQQDLLPQKKRHVASAGSDRPLLGSPGPSQDCLRSCHECRSAGVPSNERHVFLASSSFGRSGLEDVHTGSYRWGGYRDQVIGIQYVIVIVWHSSRSQWASAIAGPSWVLLNHCESTKQTKSL